MDLPDGPEWDDRDEERFALVLPFIQVVSEGGLYDDLSFAAGFQMGEISGKLCNRELLVGTFLIYSTLIRQVDLIAMRYNYATEVLHDDDTWCQIGITRVGEK